MGGELTGPPSHRWIGVNKGTDQVGGRESPKSLQRSERRGSHFSGLVGQGCAGPVFMAEVSALGGAATPIDHLVVGGTV